LILSGVSNDLFFLIIYENVKERISSSIPELEPLPEDVDLFLSKEESLEQPCQKPHSNRIYTQNGWDMDFCKITKNLDL
jgi:hypothetical protein